MVENTRIEKHNNILIVGNWCSESFSGEYTTRYHIFRHLGLCNSTQSWLWAGRPGVLRFMGSQRVRHDWATELNWTEHYSVSIICRIHSFCREYVRNCKQESHKESVSKDCMLTLRHAVGARSLAEESQQTYVITHSHWGFRVYDALGAWGQGIQPILEGVTMEHILKDRQMELGGGRCSMQREQKVRL